MCQVINFKQFGSAQALDKAFGGRWLYACAEPGRSIGRANSHAGLPASPLANPLKVQAFGGQRGVTLSHYRRWLWQRIRAGDPAVMAALNSIDGTTVLVCWCKPGPCHGDVIKAAAAWLRRQAGP